MEIEILHENPWLDLRIMRDPHRGVHGYVYSHERQCGGQIVAVLPYFLSDGARAPTYLLREEITPCWGMKPAISALTGGVDDGQTIEECALNELMEEAGYLALPSDLTNLGTCRGTKSTDTIYHLFAVDVGGMSKVPAQGDGSELEAMARMITTPDIGSAVDPLVYVLAYRLAELERLS